jgi:uncharacterized protein YqjF (DUF2071 family)
MSSGSLAVNPAAAIGRTKVVRRVFLTARWQLLAMLNWVIEPALLEPLIPRGTELDFQDGKTFISLVGFLFRHTRVLGIGVPGHCNFEEVNLRFYVRRGVEGEVRRGVAFIKEIVPRWAIAQMAHVCYNEPYVALPMRHEVSGPAAETAGTGNRESGIGEDSGRVAYSWQFGKRWNSLEVQYAGAKTPLIAGSLEQFIAEHYWGYCGQRDGSTVEYQVEHPPWNIWPGVEAKIDCDAAGLYGPQFAQVLSQPPTSAFLADGSEIAVMRPERIA